MICSTGWRTTGRARRSRLFGVAVTAFEEAVEAGSGDARAQGGGRAPHPPQGSHRADRAPLGARDQALVAPRRIVSLVPSLTEILFTLGVGDAVAGCYHLLHPAPRGGGGKDPGGGREESRSRGSSARSAPIWSSPTSRRTCASTWRRSGAGASPSTSAIREPSPKGSRWCASWGKWWAPRRAVTRWPTRSMRGTGRPRAAGRPTLPARVLPDLAQALDDARPRHLRASHAGGLRGRQRVRRPPRALPDDHAG